MPFSTPNITTAEVSAPPEKNIFSESSTSSTAAVHMMNSARCLYRKSRRRRRGASVSSVAVSPSVAAITLARADKSSPPSVPPSLPIPPSLPSDFSFSSAPSAPSAPAERFVSSFTAAPPFFTQRGLPLRRQPAQRLPKTVHLRNYPIRVPPLSARCAQARSR